MYRNCLKRVIDFVLSLLGIIILSPVLIVLAVIIKCTSRGPVFFKQKRIGKDDSYFMIYKFRTMRTDTPKDMPTHLLEDPDRFITPIGHFCVKQAWTSCRSCLTFLKETWRLWGQDLLCGTSLI